MNEIGEIEASIDAEVVFHKPVNHGFIAFDKENIYIVREKDSQFEFEKIYQKRIQSIRAKETDEYNTKDRYTESEGEKTTEESRNYTKLHISLSRETAVIVVEECPKQVTREILQLDE